MIKKKNKIKVKVEEKVKREFAGFSALIPAIPSISKPKVVEFSGDFGRADINSLRDKVNEIITFINA